MSCIGWMRRLVPAPPLFSTLRGPLHSCAARRLSSIATDRDAYAAPQGTVGAAANLTELMKTMILMRGPMSVADFMKMALGHPNYGYYMKTGSRIFGGHGDFVTSPDISQMFGEMLCIWLLSTWQQQGSPQQLGLVELGPGRAGLMKDVLRTAKRFPDFQRALLRGSEAQQALVQAEGSQAVEGDSSGSDRGFGGGLHFVETSSPLRRTQAQVLGIESSLSRKEDNAPLLGFMGSEGHLPGLSVQWHDRFQEMPKASPDFPSYIIAHELFDALPVHQLVYTKHGWRERLVDVLPESSPVVSTLAGDAAATAAASNDSPAVQLISSSDVTLPPIEFRLVVAPSPTAASLAFTMLQEQKKKQLTDHIRKHGKLPAHLPMPSEPQVGELREYSPASCQLAYAIAERVASGGGAGAALIMDYGAEMVTKATVRGIAKHAFVDMLQSPGEVDLSADVDFGGLRDCIDEGLSEGALAAAAAAGASGSSRGSSSSSSSSSLAGGAATPSQLTPVQCYGPVTQGHFLMSLGLEARLQQLLKTAAGKPEQQERLFNDAKRLVDPEQMGSIYKAFAVMPVQQPAASSGEKRDNGASADSGKEGMHVPAGFA